MKGRKWDHERKDQLDDLASGRARRMVFAPSKNIISIISTRMLCANWFLTTFTRGEGIVEILPWPGEPPERFTDESMQEKMTGVPAEDEREPGVKRSARRPPAAFAKQSPDDRRFRRSTGDARAIGGNRIRRRFFKPMWRRDLCCMILLLGSGLSIAPPLPDARLCEIVGTPLRSNPCEGRGIRLERTIEAGGRFVQHCAPEVYP